jgi:hypothetical protein
MKAKDYITYAVIGILAVCLLVSNCGKNARPSEVLRQHEYDSLQHEIIKRNNALVAIGIENNRLLRQNDSIIKLIHSNEKERDTIWRSHPDKKGAIKSLTARELERAIAERFDR